MKKNIRLTEDDLNRIVKKVLTEELINENMDNDEASFMFRKLQPAGEDMDNTYRRVKSIRDELNDRIFRQVRGETATSIFDPQIKTPHDVIESVMNLKGQLNALESAIMQYKRIVERSISL